MILSVLILFTFAQSYEGEQDVNKFTIDGVPRYSATYETCLCDSCNQSAYIQGPYENVAFNKPITSSSFENSSSQGCQAVNGFDYFADNRCWRSATGDSLPWMEIDVGYAVTIDSLFLFRQVDNGMEDKSKLQGMFFLLDSEICYHFSSSQKLTEKYPVEIRVNCSAPKTGRYLRIRRPANVNPKIVPDSIIVCEVAVWVCKIGTYGSFGKGCIACPRDCNYPCDNYWGCAFVNANVGIRKKSDKSHPGKGAASYINDGVFPLPDGKACLVMTNTDSSLLWWRVVLGQLFKVYKVIFLSRFDSKLSAGSACNTSSEYSVCDEDTVCESGKCMSKLGAKGSETTLPLVLAVLAGVGLLSLLICSIIVLFRRRRRKETLDKEIAERAEKTEPAIIPMTEAGGSQPSHAKEPIPPFSQQDTSVCKSGMSAASSTHDPNQWSSSVTPV